MSKHTPGPWNVYHSDEAEALIGRRDEPTAHVASADSFDQDNEANARLIASAPDLLSALEEMVDCYWGTEEDPAQGKALAKARAAIAKATGEA